MKKILILLFTLAMCQGNLFGQTDNNTSNRFLKAQYFGKVGGNTGSIIFTGTTSGNVTLKSADIAGTWSLTLPSTAGTANYPLLTNGSGVTSWGVLPIAGGGTNISSYAIGDIIYASGATTLSKLAIGTANQQLRVNAGATALEYFTPSSGGITVGTTTITSGTTGSVLMDIGGIVTESISYRAQQATPFSTAFGFSSMAGNSGVDNSAFGYNAGLGQTTGTDNLYLGYNAGFRNISGSRNIYLGGLSGDVLSTNLSDNIFIGVGAGLHATGSLNVVVGAGSNTGSGIGTSNTIVGYQAYFNSASTPTYNVAVGWWSGKSSSGNFNTYLGPGAGNGATTSSSIGLGIYALPSQNNELMIGGNTADYFTSTAGITNVCIGNGNTYTSAANVTIRVTGGSGSNNAGGNFTIAGGRGTGTASGGNVKSQTSVKGSSGTTLQTLTDRHNIVGKYVDITAGSAQTFGNLALATSATVAGGTVIYTIEANDATDYQSLSGILKYDVVNKAGALTVAFEDDQNGAGACSAGTLTATVTATASGTNVLFQANAASSLTETTLRVSFQVLNNFGQAVITPN